MRSRSGYMKIRQSGDDDEDDEDEDEEEEEAMGSSDDDDGNMGSLVSSFNALRVVLDNSAKILAPGGGEYASELKSLFIANEYAGWEATLLRNTRTVLESTGANSEASRTVRALFLQSMENQALANHRITTTKGAAAARVDFAALEQTGRLPRRKGNPRGKSHVSDEAVKNAVRTVLGACSTTAWTKRMHVVKPDCVRTSISSSSHELGEDDEKFLLPALHRLMSRSEMLGLIGN